MKALVWTEGRKLELCEMPEPIIVSANDVKVEIHMTGICGTDLAVITGKEEGVAGIIRGHEAVGIVVEVGDNVQQLSIGDRVVIDPNQSCGECYYCNRDNPHLCVGSDGSGMPIAGLNRQGTFARYFVCDKRFIHKLDDGMSWEAAVLIEPLACVLHNFEAARVTSEETVLVLGSGPMGMLCQYVSTHKTRVTVATEVNPYRLSRAQEIADLACSPDQLHASMLEGLTQNGKFDVVIDTVGNQLEMAERWIDRGGRMIAFGINAKYEYTCKPTKMIQNAIQLIGAGEYRYKFEEAIQFAKEHPELQGIVTKKYNLEDCDAAVGELLESSRVTDKGVISPVSQTLKTVFVFE
ncbi:zinc-dependent alcohol dehydrogenase [Paenibacillus hexagrammi]|uniref:Alcohol dehydrogenase catalytic domain-containing protein n=1 Tax=Paenibacillus hexagrammi TaxID=2908839 RepID=A0ABY3SEZ6_9BACL|nr:alcohol dehydrogenase catalytic domain-containing protein [Paenibacillus sp. YPD9-1]UJF31756.1 alcohol dehydrogenase catalytic domain-containing protein [Paenibacillus sp. YPD9-1]